MLPGPARDGNGGPTGTAGRANPRNPCAKATMQIEPDEFAQLVQQAVDSLPEQFRQKMENLTVEIQPIPTPELMRRYDIKGRNSLLGLYVGVPLTKKSVLAPYEFPEAIYIFQNTIQRICRTREQVVQQVRDTVLHEIAHHFGFEEDDIQDLGY